MKKLILVLAIVCIGAMAHFAFANGGDACMNDADCPEEDYTCHEELNICVYEGAALCFSGGVYSHGCAHPGNGCICGGATVMDSRKVD